MKTPRNEPALQTMKPPICKIAHTASGKRVEQVSRFWRKKYKQKAADKLQKKFVHKKKSKVAHKKLRVNGKFVTVEQAI